MQFGWQLIQKKAHKSVAILIYSLVFFLIVIQVFDNEPLSIWPSKLMYRFVLHKNIYIYLYTLVDV